MTGQRTVHLSPTAATGDTTVNPTDPTPAQAVLPYNGWSNYATWNTNLWLANDEPLYRAVESIRLRISDPDPDRRAALLADQIAYLVRSRLTLFPDLTRPDLDAVDWREIADAWLEDSDPAPARGPPANGDRSDEALDTDASAAPAGTASPSPPVHTVRGKPAGPERLALRHHPRHGLPGLSDTPYTASPRSETYWAS